MSGYDMQWIPTQWKVKQSNDPDISEHDILKFEGQGGAFRDSTNKLFNVTKGGGQPWASAFSYDQAHNFAYDVSRGASNLIIGYTPAHTADPNVPGDKSTPATLTCEPLQELVGMIPGNNSGNFPRKTPTPTGGSCWVAEAGG